MKNTPSTPSKKSKKKGTGRVETVKLTSADIATVSADELVKSDSGAEKGVDNAQSSAVDSSQAQKTSSDATSDNERATSPTQTGEVNIMASASVLSLVLDPKQRKSTSVVYKFGNGVRGSVRIAKTAFPGGNAPDKLDIGSEAENAFAAPKAKLTAEQRKEARKNAPKLTAAQKLAKLNERAAKLQAKIDADAAAAAAPAAAAQ